MNRKKLGDLRKEVQRLDDAILKLAQKRTSLAGEIGRIKLTLGFPVRDYETEREVLTSARAKCERYGLDPTLGREITRALIAGAVKEQESIHEKRFLGSKAPVTILGGRGKMGGWLARYFHSRGHQVVIHDPAGPLSGFRSEASFDRAVDGAGILLVSVPLHTAGAVYKRILRRKPTGMIIDVFSLKSPVLDSIWSGLDAGLSIGSIHPLFGPEVYLLSDRILLLCPCGHARADRAIGDLFSGTSLGIARIPVEEHDRVMGLVLGLSHAVNIVFTEALASSGLPWEDLRRAATTTFEKQARSAGEVAGENPRLYYDIQHLNEHTPVVFRRFEEAFAAFRRSALSRSPRSFEAMMARGRKFYAEG
jgi:chorismate mutase/prephenate dehydrogenase